MSVRATVALIDNLLEKSPTIGDANRIILMEAIFPVLRDALVQLENELNQLRERCDERKTQMTRDINRLKGVHGL